MGAVTKWHLCGAFCSVTDRNSQPDPRRTQLPVKKDYSPKRGLAKDLLGQEETLLYVHPHVIFLGAVSGPFSAAYQA